MPIINVHMLGMYNEIDKVREVDLPRSIDRYDNLHALLDDIYKYGQNDFQPRQICSVSVGDVIDLTKYKSDNGPIGYYMVASLGFKSMTEADFNVYRNMTRDERFNWRYS